MNKRAYPLLVQFVEYMVGGGVWFVVGYIVFALCYGFFGWIWWVAKLLADIIGWSLNYVIQRYWAFASPALAKYEGRVSVRYIAIMAVNAGIDFAIVGGLAQLGVTPYIGLLAAAAFFTVWNYLWYRFWVFSPKA